MIATGGLLRINARRQDSLRSKALNTNTQKRKTRKKRRSEVVIVKGKLKFCSLSAVLAALGILVLLVGVVMVAIGYWPRDGLFFTTQPQEGSTLTSTPHRDEPGRINGTELFNGTTQQLPRGFLDEFLDR
ncbi:transmembrane protein 200C-like [Thalassophryne amazonica]|uniref:transmembrane protein 200C-like n=1 Tax=Thalassophryne amazonica TaxID=390379 RepID=UPI001471AD18|nr:transmembrane protein 200C-like [Thalassophryne amazonica]